MTQFLTVMEDIDLGDQLKRATARKIVDEKLQVVVKVRYCNFILFKSSIPIIFKLFFSS